MEYGMEAVSYTYLRQHLKKVLDYVAEGHETMIVTRKNGQNMVIVSQEDYNAMEETAYLMRSPANFERLEAALKNSSEGKIMPFELPKEGS
jgi:antitoxin YefM